MTYNQIMQMAGKEISPSIYYTISGTTTTLGRDDIISAKVYFNAPILGTIMSGLSVEVKTTLPTETAIYFKNIATYGTNTANKVYGPYYVKDSQYNADTRTYSIELYDEFLTTMVEYTPITINYPATIYDFFVELVDELGFTTSIASLPNGSLTINNDIYEGINYTFRDVLNDIAQATASRFKISNGDIDLAPLGTTTISIDDDILKNQNISFGEHFGPINTIVLSRSADSDRIYYPDPLPANPIEFKISDNQLMNNDDRDTFMSAIYNELNGLEYDIYDTQLIGYGGFTPLDKLSISTIDNGTTKTYSSYVFNNEQTFTQGYDETIYTDLPDESVSDYKVMSSTDKLLHQTNLIVNKQEGTITAITGELQMDSNGNSQVIDGILVQQNQNSLDIEAITSYEMIDGKETLTGVKTTTGFTFNTQGLIIQSSKNTYKAIHNETGDYYYDGDAPLGETTNDGSKFKNMDLYGEFRYGKDDIGDPALFVSMQYTANINGVDEVGFGHFWNGD